MRALMFPQGDRRASLALGRRPLVLYQHGALSQGKSVFLLVCGLAVFRFVGVATGEWGLEAGTETKMVYYL